MSPRRWRTNGSSPPEEETISKKQKPWNDAFAALEARKKEMLAEERAKEEAKKAPPKPAPKPRHAPELSEADAFKLAVMGVSRVRQDGRGRREAPEPPRAEELPTYNEDAEVLAELASLVEGTGHFDIADTEEFIEGCVEGLDRRILRNLRRGDYSVAAHTDLHGMTRETAKGEVERFLLESRRRGHRCVLVVHGRGLNSKDQIPVLKTALATWFEHTRIGGHVLAFCSARPHDGGTGAVYVLLRK